MRYLLCAIWLGSHRVGDPSSLARAPTKRPQGPQIDKETGYHKDGKRDEGEETGYHKDGKSNEEEETGCHKNRKTNEGANCKIPFGVHRTHRIHSIVCPR